MLRIVTKSRMVVAVPLVVAAVAGGVVAHQHFAGKDRTKVLGISVKQPVGDGSGAANNGNGAGGGNSAPPAKNFDVAGTVTGLAPGVLRQIPLRLKNNNNQTIRVETLTASASGGTFNCPDSMLLFGPSASPGSGSITVSVGLAANASTTVATDPTFPVQLSPDAPNACKNFTWKLSFHGSAVKG